MEEHLQRLTWSNVIQIQQSIRKNVTWILESANVKNADGDAQLMLSFLESTLTFQRWFATAHIQNMGYELKLIFLAFIYSVPSIAITIKQNLRYLFSCNDWKLKMKEFSSKMMVKELELELSI